jgi:hypothetical protein
MTVARSAPVACGRGQPVPSGQSNDGLVRARIGGTNEVKPSGGNERG